VADSHFKMLDSRVVLQIFDHEDKLVEANLESVCAVINGDQLEHSQIVRKSEILLIKDRFVDDHLL
jgi:hypothetical protein